MRTWKFELDHCYIEVNYYEDWNTYGVHLRYYSGWEADFKSYKNKGAVNRYLKSWGIGDRI